MSLKSGVRVLGLRPETVLAMTEARDVCKEMGVELYITSVIDGTHKRASAHYAGCAFDFRRPDWPSFNDTPKATALVTMLAARLGPDYDVILESDHVHVEFQPKVGY